MRTIAITGRTGVGKSRLLASLPSRKHMMLVDPLANPARDWAAPDPRSCGGVVVDHAYHLKDAKEVVAEITAWCEQHDVTLWIAEDNLSDLHSRGIVLPEDTFELHLLYPDEADTSEQSDKRVSVTLKAGGAFAKQFVTVQ